MLSLTILHTKIRMSKDFILEIKTTKPTPNNECLQNIFTMPFIHEMTSYIETSFGSLVGHIYITNKAISKYRTNVILLHVVLANSLNAVIIYYIILRISQLSFPKRNSEPFHDQLFYSILVFYYKICVLHIVLYLTSHVHYSS